MAEVPKHYLAWVLRGRKKFTLRLKRWRLVGKLADLWQNSVRLIEKERQKKNASFLYCYNQVASKTFAIAKFNHFLMHAANTQFAETDISALKDV